MTDKTLDDLDAVRTIVDALKNFKPEEQERILRWAMEKVGLRPFVAPAHSAQSSTSPSAAATAFAVTPPPHPPSTSSAVDIKTFIDEKQPRSDVQFAATVAYYLRFEAPPVERKDSINKEDLQDACRKAKRDRLKNPYQTLVNAHMLGLLDKGPEKATFAINTVGENLVAMALPGDGKTSVRPSKNRKPKPANLRKASASKKATTKKASAKKASQGARKG